MKKIVLSLLLLSLLLCPVALQAMDPEERTKTAEPYTLEQAQQDYKTSRAAVVAKEREIREGRATKEELVVLANNHLVLKNALHKLQQNNATKNGD